MVSKINIPCPVSISTYPNILLMLTIEYQHPGIHKFSRNSSQALLCPMVEDLFLHSSISWIPKQIEHLSQNPLMLSFLWVSPRIPSAYSLAFSFYNIFIHDNLTCFLIKKLLLSSQTTGAKPKRLNLSLMITYSHRQRNRTAVLSVK